MSIRDEFLANAERCEAMARTSKDAFLRQALEEVALGWRRLLATEAGQYADCAFGTAEGRSARLAA